MTEIYNCVRDSHSRDKLGRQGRAKRSLTREGSREGSAEESVERSREGSRE